MLKNWQSASYKSQSRRKGQTDKRTPAGWGDYIYQIHRILFCLPDTLWRSTVVFGVLCLGSA